MSEPISESITDSVYKFESAESGTDESTTEPSFSKGLYGNEPEYSEGEMASKS